MESDEIRENIKYIFGIFFPLLMSISITIMIVDSAPIELIWFTIGLAIVTSVLIPIYIFSEFICRFNWKRKHKKYLKKSSIAIINEDEDKLTKTKFTPEYWQKLLSEKLQFCVLMKTFEYLL